MKYLPVGRCNNCLTYFTKWEWDTIKICPKCKTDEYLMDILLEEAKPTANADLVGELTQVLEDWEINGNPMQKLELEAILSKYRPVPVVKEQGEAGLRNKAYGECKNVGKTCRACYAEYCTTRVYEVPPLPTPAPVASGLVEAKDNIEKAMKGITERQTQEDSYWRGYYNCLEETWDSLNVQISRYSKEAK